MAKEDAPQHEGPADEEMEGPDAAAGADDSSSSSSDDEENEIPPEALTKLMQLKAALEANPNLYDKHVEVRASSLLLPDGSRWPGQGGRTVQHRAHRSQARLTHLRSARIKRRSSRRGPCSCALCRAAAMPAAPARGARPRSHRCTHLDARLALS